MSGPQNRIRDVHKVCGSVVKYGTLSKYQITRCELRSARLMTAPADGGVAVGGEEQKRT